MNFALFQRFTDGVVQKSLNNLFSAQNYQNSDDLSMSTEDYDHNNHKPLEAFFIGPKGENSQYFYKLIQASIASNVSTRQNFHPKDQSHITEELKQSPSYLQAQNILHKNFMKLLTKLKKLSTPYYSPRYYGHMCWQNSIPSLVGYFATMLYNPNNVTFQCAALTIKLEVQCMKQFAWMFGYPPLIQTLKQKDINKTLSYNSWGHFTSGGTISNTEAFWAARNLKFLPFGLKKYVQSLSQNDFELVKHLQVKIASGQSKKLLQTSVWQLLNVTNTEALNLSINIFKLMFQKKQKQYEEFLKKLKPFMVEKLGLVKIYNLLQEENKIHPDPHWTDNKVPTLKALYSASAHYSITKALSLLGMGQDAGQSIQVDLDCRIDTNKLQKKLNECLQNHIPVFMVIAIVGTTSQSAVDNLAQILTIRQSMMKKGMYFHIHIDASYGGYFLSMMKNKKEDQINSLSEYTQTQLAAFCQSDSITFDPHKLGYIPYSCGGVIYRDHRLRMNLNFKAPVIFAQLQPNNAIFGIQGSKPGAPMAALYLSLEALPLIRSGHGEILQRTMRNTKIFYTSLKILDKMLFQININGVIYKERFKSCLQARSYTTKKCIPQQQAQNTIFKKISDTHPQKMQELIQDNQIRKHYYEAGPDFNVVSYGINYFDKQQQCWNKSLKKYNLFNKMLIEFCKPLTTDKSLLQKDLFVSQYKITSNYGDYFINDFLQRNGLERDDSQITMIRSTIMNPFFTQSSKQGHNAIFLNELGKNCCKALDKMKKMGKI